MACCLGCVLAPFWINYLMRMLAWVNLLRRTATSTTCSRALHVVDRRADQLAGGPAGRPVILGLVYGYMPVLHPAAVRRPRPHRPQRCSRPRATSGMGPLRTFLRVTLPLSKQGMLAGVGHHRAADVRRLLHDTLLSGSPRTSMIGNQIEFYLLEGSQTEGRGAWLVDPVGPADGARWRTTWSRPTRATRELPRSGDRGAPRATLVVATPGASRDVPGRRLTWVYVLWSLVPVLIAIQFSFNDGRSRSTWQGFSLRWWCERPGSVAVARPDAARRPGQQPVAGGASRC